MRVRFRYRCKGKEDILNNKIKVENIPLKRVNEQNGLKTPVVAIFTAEIGKVTGYRQLKIECFNAIIMPLKKPLELSWRD